MSKPLQGVLRIIRFNWPFYAAAGVLAMSFLVVHVLVKSLPGWVSFLFILSLIPLLISLFVSAWVYDFSELYTLNWVPEFLHVPSTLLNIHAGYDETSALIRKKYPQSALIIFDFYDPEKHTEPSIRRARQLFPPDQHTVMIQTGHLPVASGSADGIFLLLAAHEIRDRGERLAFFKELNRVLHPDGMIILTEHLRDGANLFAYSLGAFHFHTRKTWTDAFRASGLIVSKETKITPFITTFVLRKNGNAS